MSFVVDFTTLPVGVATSATLSALGITSARGDTNITVQTGPSTIVSSGFGPNDMGIGSVPIWSVNQLFGQTNGGSPPQPLGNGPPGAPFVGLSLNESRTNYAVRSEDFTASGWTANGSTVTAAAFEAPDGRVVANRIQTPSATGGPFYTSTQAGTGYRVSVWLRTVPVGLLNAAQDSAFGTDVTPSTVLPLPSLSDTWQRFGLTTYWTAGTQYLWPAVGLSETNIQQPTFNPSVYAGARSVAASFAQIEQGDTAGSAQYVQFSTEYIPSTAGGSVTRLGETIAITNGASCVQNGVLSLWLRFTPKGDLAAYTTSRYLLYSDANNNVLLTAGGILVVKFNGISQTMQPIYWRAGDVVDIFILCGAIPTQVWYRRPGDCTLPLHWGQSALGAITVPGSLFVLSGGGAPALSAHVQRIDSSFSASSPPPWVRAYTTPKKLFVVHAQSLGFGYGTRQNNYLTSFVAIVAQALGSSWQVINQSVSGISTPNLTTLAPAFIDALFNLARPKFVILAWEGTNDLTNNANATTTYNNIVTLYTARKTFAATYGAAGTALYRSIAGTIIDRNVVGFNALAATVNGNLRANVPGSYADALFDAAADPLLGAANASTNTTYFADGIHPTDAGAAIKARLLVPIVLSQ